MAIRPRRLRHVQRRRPPQSPIARRAAIMAAARLAVTLTITPACGVCANGCFTARARAVISPVRNAASRVIRRCMPGSRVPATVAALRASQVQAAAAREPAE